MKLAHKDNFVVDAAILQELGERLIGRPAIALGELIKNAFDADARICRIEFAADQVTFPTMVSECPRAISVTIG